MKQGNNELRLNAEEDPKSFFSQLIIQASKMQIKDWISLFFLCIAFFPGKIWKLFRPHMWVVSEYECLARDNGYWFFKYVRENYPSQTVFYPISKKSSDRYKVDAIGNVIQFSSLKHYMLFWAADKQFTTSKNAGFPSRICEDLVLWNFHRFEYILLNHGITRGKSTVVDSKKTNYDFICTCSALDKRIIVEDNFQPSRKVILTGFARHDNLDNSLTRKDLILVMPTWRKWLDFKNSSDAERKNMLRDFQNTDFYQKYDSLLSDNRLIDFLEKKNIKLYFYLHDYAQAFSGFFSSKSKNIMILKDDNDIQTLLKRSSLLVTDFSSVCYDFAYMQKPVIYYQFDLEKFEYYQYKAGPLYDYERNGMGEIFSEKDDLVAGIIESQKNGFIMTNEYKKRAKEFFSFHDKLNCERIYNYFRYR